MGLTRDIIAYCIMPLLDQWDFCSASQVSKLWSESGKLWLHKGSYLKHALRYYALFGMWKEYEKHSTVPSFVDISNAIKGGKTEFVMHFINSIPEINLENRLSDDAKKLKGYLYTCIEYSRNDLFTLLYMRGGWYFPRLIVDAADHGNLFLVRQMVFSCPNLDLAVTRACVRKHWDVYHYLISKGAKLNDEYKRFNERALAASLMDYRLKIDSTQQVNYSMSDVEEDYSFLELFN